MFTVLQPVSDVVLLGYGLTVCLRVIAVVRQPVSPLQRAQLQLLTFGMVVGLLPFLLLTALPLFLIGRWWVPGTVSVLPFAVLLPLNLSLAILRTEVFGIVGILRRRTLQALVRGLLFLTIALAAAEFAIAGAHHWGWAPAPSIVLASIGTAAISLLLAPSLTRKLERIFVPDLYDPSEALVQLSAAFAGSDLKAIGPLVVTGIGTRLDLDFVLLVTPTAQFVWRHDRASWSAALLQETMSLAPVSDERWGDQTRGLAVGTMQLPILVALSLQQDDAGETMLCCGPKHNGEAYSSRDQALLQALGHQLRVLFRQQAVEARLSDQNALLHTLREDDGSLTGDELAVLSYAAQGCTNQEISLRMAVHRRTVEKHLTAIYRKWGVAKRSEALHVARRKGLIPSEPPWKI